MSDPTNTQGTPGPDEQADVASGGAPEEPDTLQEQIEKLRKQLDDETTDENGQPLENPSGG